jgi:hypothetical protein
MLKIRCLLACALLPALLTPALRPARAQVSAPPVQITAEQSGARANDVYSPKLIYQTINGKPVLVMYFGGWYRTNPYTLPNDSIYRAVCSAPTQCGAAQKVIDPVAAGLGSAAMLNNPTIVQLNNFGRPYLLMYMTGVTGDDRTNGQTVQNNQIYWSMSWADDGVNWSKPQLLLNDAWLPSATLDANNNVILYANTNWNENPYFLSRWNLGQSGIAVARQQPVSTSNGINYINVEVKYRPQIGLYQMLAQQVTSAFNSQVDYLYSTDGARFTLGVENVIPPSMTPGVHPDSSCYVYYGYAPGLYLSNVYFKRWC